MPKVKTQIQRDSHYNENICKDRNFGNEKEKKENTMSFWMLMTSPWLEAISTVTVHFAATILSKQRLLRTNHKKIREAIKEMCVWRHVPASNSKAKKRPVKTGTSSLNSRSNGYASLLFLINLSEDLAGEMSQSKLTRTQSSLLRSSPTIRSSIHSLSSITERDFNEAFRNDLEAGEKEEKQRRSKKQSKSINRTGLIRIKPGLTFTLASLSLASFLLFSVFFSQTGTSENLLLGLIFLAVALFFASRNMAVINQTVLAIKQTSKKLTLRTKPKPVQWYIGDSKPEQTKPEEFVREGVQLFITEISTKESSTEEEAREVEFTTITLTDVTKEIGSTEDTTATESSLGPKEASTKDSTSKELDTATEFTGFTPEILTPANGSTVKATALVFRHVLMEALMSESLSLVLNMDLDLTISGMVISMQGSIMETRFMGLVFTISLMVIIMKELGMKVVNKAMVRMDLEPEMQNVVNGMMVISLTGFL
ncbi:hypothetical protein YC2023_017360 [Brassica napus]